MIRLKLFSFPRVQVLAFDSPDTAYAYLASGLAEDIRAELLGTHAVVVVGPNASRALADFVLSGSVRRSAEGVTVACRLERIRSGDREAPKDSDESESECARFHLVPFTAFIGPEAGPFVADSAIEWRPAGRP